MASQRVRKASELTGLEIYQDPKRGTIFYDFITRKGYNLVTSDVKTYMLYEATLPIAIVCGSVLYLWFKVSSKLSIILAIAVYVLLFFVFRIFYLYKLPVAENWIKPKRGSLIKFLATKYSKGRVIALIVLFLICATLTVIDIYVDKLTGLTRIVMYILAGIAYLGFVVSALALSYKKKNNINY